MREEQKVSVSFYSRQNFNNTFYRNKNINQEDIAKLQFLHVQTELQVLKLKAVLKDILGKVMKKKKYVYVSI